MHSFVTVHDSINAALDALANGDITPGRETGQVEYKLNEAKLWLGVVPGAIETIMDNDGNDMAPPIPAGSGGNTVNVGAGGPAVGVTPPPSVTTPPSNPVAGVAGVPGGTGMPGLDAFRAAQTTDPNPPAATPAPVTTGFTPGQGDIPVAGGVEALPGVTPPPAATGVTGRPPTSDRFPLEQTDEENPRFGQFYRRETVGAVALDVYTNGDVVEASAPDRGKPSTLPGIPPPILAPDSPTGPSAAV